MNLSGVFIAGYSSGTVATVFVSNGGQISGAQGTLGDLAGSSGTMTVSGSGSKWSAFVNAVPYTGYMNVGRLGSGNLTITDGGSVIGYRLYIGNEAGSTGTATLSGRGSLIQMGSNLYVGSDGTGTLTLSDGAHIDAAAIKVGYRAGAVGTLNIGAAAGQSAAAAGTINATEIVLGDGDSRLVLNHTGSDYGIAANITGTGRAFALNGTTILTGTNTYTGATTLSGGTLRVGNGGTTGSIVSDVTDNAALIFDRSDNLTYAGVVAGSGTLEKKGAGTLTLTGANDVRGGTTISGGTLQIGDGGTSGSITGNVTNNGVLAFARSDAIGFAGAISGTGSVAQNGTGTVTLTGANTYSGGTSITAGTLRVFDGSVLGGGPLALSGTGTLRTSGSFTMANGVTLTASGGTGGGSFNVDADTALTLPGAIGGTGALTKLGTGTLVLTGTNTYGGGTTIKDGTLQIGNGGTTGSIAGKVLNNASLVFNRSDSYTFTDAITGSGPVTFMGGGKVAFSSPYTGPVAVNNTFAQLQAGTVTASPFTVNAGGVLGGTATIGGLTVNAGGTAAPGYSPGTLTVRGAVAFNAGSVYAVDVTPRGAHDLILATGAVTITPSASVQVAAVPGLYARKSTIPIITTSGAVSGTFGSVTSDYAFLSPQLTYDAQNVYLRLTYSGLGFIDYARTRNEANVALAAQALGVANPVYQAIIALPQGAVAPAFDRLSGEIYPSVDTVIQQQSIYLREAVGARLRQTDANGADSAGALSSAANTVGPASAKLSQDLAPTVWMHGYGGWGRSFGNANAASISNNVGGFFGGIDAGIVDTMRVGLVGGFSQSQFGVNARNSSGKMANYDVGLYAGDQWGAFALRGGLSYTWHDISVARSVNFAGFNASKSSNYTLGTTQLFSEVGYDIRAGSYDFEPFLGLAYLNVSGGSLTERGAGAAGLSGRTEAQNTLYSTLGLRAATTFDLGGHALTPSITLGWQHAVGDTTPIANLRFLGGTTPFRISGVPIAQDAALLGAGIAYDLSDLAKLQFVYSGQIAGKASQNAFSTQFSLQF